MFLFSCFSKKALFEDNILMTLSFVWLKEPIKVAKPKPKKPVEEQRKTEKTRVDLRRRIPQEFQDFAESRLSIFRWFFFFLFVKNKENLDHLQMNTSFPDSDQFLKMLTLFFILGKHVSQCGSPPASTRGRPTCACRSARMLHEDAEEPIEIDPSPRKSCWQRPGKQQNSTSDLLVKIPKLLNQLVIILLSHVWSLTSSET